MRQQGISHEEHPQKVLVLFLAAIVGGGCSHLHSDLDNRRDSFERKVFALKEITPDQARVFLSQLGMTEVSVSSKHSAVMVAASKTDLQKAGAALDLVDAKDEFVIENLAPVSRARKIPTNDRIAAALGDASIGTFADPPESGEQGRAIIDIHGESVLKFKGFAATCHKGNLVTIVPVTDALDMDRIERLLEMIDRPGRPKEFRSRALRYTMAKTIVGKVKALVAELQTALCDSPDLLHVCA